MVFKISVQLSRPQDLLLRFDVIQFGVLVNTLESWFIFDAYICSRSGDFFVFDLQISLFRDNTSLCSGFIDSLVSVFTLFIRVMGFSFVILCSGSALLSVVLAVVSLCLLFSCFHVRTLSEHLGPSVFPCLMSVLCVLVSIGFFLFYFECQRRFHLLLMTLNIPVSFSLHVLLSCLWSCGPPCGSLCFMDSLFELCFSVHVQFLLFLSACVHSMPYITMELNV